MTFQVGDRVANLNSLEEGVVVGTREGSNYVQVHYDWYIEEEGEYQEDDWHSARISSLRLVNPRDKLKGIAKFIRRVEEDYYDKAT